MATLIPVPGQDGRGTTHYKAVDDSGRTLAVGKLEVDLTPGAQRHGSVAFVTPPAEETDAFQKAIEKQAQVTE